jgi:hypothetical protein
LGGKDRFSLRIHEWLDAHNIRLDLNSERITTHIKYVLSKQAGFAVNLPFNDARSMTAFKCCTENRGDLVYDKEPYKALEPKRASGIFCDYKGFFPYRTAGFWINCAYIDKEGRRIGFSMGDMSGRADNQIREPAKNNENGLWVDGVLTLLPPVRITQGEGEREGVGKMWTIQDVEGMVDLTFTPQEEADAGFNWFIAHENYNSLLGEFNGELLTAKGTKITLRNVFGQAEKAYLRV